jgi:hypothetical protein
LADKASKRERSSEHSAASSLYAYVHQQYDKFMQQTFVVGFWSVVLKT